MKKAVSNHRTEIAALKRRAQSLEQELRRSNKSLPKPHPAAPDVSSKSVRFSAKDLASQRQRLALTIEEATRRWGEPNGYILGQEASGAFVGGLRYGEGILYTRNAGDRKVFWQGPHEKHDRVRRC